MAKKKIRPMGQILLDIEPFLLEMADHDLQWGDYFGLLYSYLQVHLPGLREEYEDGSHPNFIYTGNRMKEFRIPLTKGQYALVDEDDYYKFNAFKWQAYKLGSSGQYYAARTVRIPGEDGKLSKKRMIYLHRLIMNAQKGEEVDHINNNPLDNKKSNLRICNHRQNIQNKKHTKLPMSGYKGVKPQKNSKTWFAEINVNGQRIRTKGFYDKKDAARAYNELAIKYFGEFANINEGV